MSFNPEQVAALKAKLDPAFVASREQSGRRLSYVEGWHVIAEANRIFGFDAWHRETVDIRCVSERERKIGRAPNQKDGWGVSYVARCRVVVDGVTREGVGAGHGIDADLGLAHESAIKEAETDAMKRALMTFGNPFGLALYDKTQENVGKPDAGVAPNSAEIRASMLDYIKQIQSVARADQWWRDQSRKGSDGRNAFDALAEDDWLSVEAAFRARRGEIARGTPVNTLEAG